MAWATCRSTAGASAASAAAAGPGTSGGADERLFEALRAWRAQVAREHGVPAYVVFHDSTLRVIAQARPASEGELAAIPGVGEKKLASYGAAIIGVVRVS